MTLEEEIQRLVDEFRIRLGFQTPIKRIEQHPEFKLKKRLILKRHENDVS